VVAVAVRIARAHGRTRTARCGGWAWERASTSCLGGVAGGGGVRAAGMALSASRAACRGRAAGAVLVVVTIGMSPGMRSWRGGVQSPWAVHYRRHDPEDHL
jgi:hypothetical protein